jgi:hypothetical protein
LATISVELTSTAAWSAYILVRREAFANGIVGADRRPGADDDYATTAAAAAARRGRIGIVWANVARHQAHRAVAEHVAQFVRLDRPDALVRLVPSTEKSQETLYSRYS